MGSVNQPTIPCLEWCIVANQTLQANGSSLVHKNVFWATKRTIEVGFWPVPLHQGTQKGLRPTNRTLGFHLMVSSQTPSSSRKT
jgi:hypothetical protein